MSDKYEINTPQHFRIRILDELLASKRKYTRIELIDLVRSKMEFELNIADYSYSDRSFGNDKKYIETKLNELNDKDSLLGKNSYSIIVDESHRYFYSHPEISICKNKLGFDEINKLIDIVNLIQQIKGFDSKNEIQSILKELDSQIKYRSTGTKQVIGLQSMVADGYEYLDDLYNRIISESVIEINYKPYTKEKEKIIIHPYFLKQYNSRWFLLGYDETYKRISNIALDRIKSISKPLNKLYKSPEKIFNPTDYFKDIIGVTNYADKPVEEIILAFSKSSAPYVTSKKIHESQETIEQKEDGTTIVKLHVKINFELLSFIKSYGSQVTILQPQSLVDQVKKEAKEIVANYKKV